jgi:hypothetical protein
MKIGICKECLADVPINESTSCGPAHPNVFECEVCSYPHVLNDFWQIYENDSKEEVYSN